MWVVLFGRDTALDRRAVMPCEIREGGGGVRFVRTTERYFEKKSIGSGTSLFGFWISNAGLPGTLFA